MAMDEDDGALNRGGWKTFPFIIGAKLAVGVAAFGLSSNLTVYLIQQFNVASIDATQISTIVAAFNQFAPVVGAVAADAGLGCFNVIVGASVACFLGTVIFTLIATVPSLRPPPCALGFCKPPTNCQLALLYTAITLLFAGLGGTRFISATLGAFQLDTAAEQATFFNWYVVALYTTAVVGVTVIVYVQVNVSWAWGFGVCTILSIIGLVVFLSGSRYYRHPKPQKNPFLVMLGGVMPGNGRRKEEPPKTETDTESYRLLEDRSTRPKGLTTCMSSNDQILTHTESSEDVVHNFSPLIRLIPLMSSGFFLALYTSIAASLTILQALVMDCNVGPAALHFTIPASSMSVFTSAACIIFVPLLEHAIFPLWKKLSNNSVTPLQVVGLGHLLTILAAITAATTESRRLEALALGDKPASVLWLVSALVLVGFGDSLHFPGTLALYHQEFPASLKSLATGVIALSATIGFYGSTVTIALVQVSIPWLQNDTNKSRLDNVYWMLAVVGAINYGYFLVCAKLYR